jgi:hypothetical protein
LVPLTGRVGVKDGIGEALLSQPRVASFKF